MRPETKYRKWTIERYTHWSELYEPGLGSGIGYPDVQLLCPSTFRLFPLEFKVGKAVKEDGGLTIFPEEVRASQVKWHYMFHRAGGVSAVIVGVPNGKLWDGYAINGKDLFDNDYKNGWWTKDLFHIRAAFVAEDLQRLMIEMFNKRF